MSTSRNLPDERDWIEFDTTYVLAEVFPDRINAPDHLRRCSVCGIQSQALPASKLTVIKHRHGGQPSGHLRLYCDEHVGGAKEWSENVGGVGGKTGPFCPNCFVNVPFGTGICDSCGEKPFR